MNTNNGAKNFIFYGLTYGILFFILGFLLSYYCFHFPVRKAIASSLLVGGISFILNGFMQGRFNKSSKKLDKITVVLQEDEEIKLIAPANHTIDEHLISGKLVVTQKRLVFTSLEKKEYSWPLTSFQSFKFYPSIFNTGGEFIVTDNSNDTLVFEVDEIKKWKQKLTNRE